MLGKGAYTTQNIGMLPLTMTFNCFILMWAALDSAHENTLFRIC